MFSGDKNMFCASGLLLYRDAREGEGSELNVIMTLNIPNSEMDMLPYIRRRSVNYEPQNTAIKEADPVA